MFHASLCPQGMGVYMKVLMFTASQTFMLCCVRWSDMAVLYENPRGCRFSDFHLLLWAASANHHDLPMAVI